jgi:hypothetical protein
MNTVRKLLASIATLLAACLVHAADSKPASRVMTTLDIETDDPTGYATWIAQYNEVAKAKLGIDPYLRVYQSWFDGRGTTRLRVVAAAASVAELVKNNEVLENDPAIVQIVGHMRPIRKLGARVLYQAVYFDGPTPKGASTFTTQAVITDEAGYVKALAQLRTIFDAIGLKDAKIGGYRTLVGRTDHTHRITISLPSAERLGVFLDLMASNQKVADWLASVATIRTVVTNFSSREITR